MGKYDDFQKKLYRFYKENYRHLPWRVNDLFSDKKGNPYKILVSEMMLQQTQVSRVIEKYKSFLKKFPTVKAPAEAPQTEVLKEWQGLGYNRRALYLKHTAEAIVEKYNGKFPKDYESLLSLPGIGQSTAGAIIAFAWNIPVVFIETNIRSVFIHEFFKNKENISDKEILPLIEKTLDTDHPRDFYYALMDYGVHLKQKENHSRKSKHYVKQTKFKGSHREARAQVLKFLLAHPRIKSTKIISQKLNILEEKVVECITQLKQEGFIN
ncbi:MAG: endonuclease III [Candidatus Zambryskibacteria bacterium CG10_big_fil_rev_8_21_14_0_10_42_12]|uniref:Adenine DNA glycosylase n=1 Tax=Candidatus Zambryskibacteria bacterium CG10_big_fil_rev_8_21_14_0_10_42_12 TaxID=1975115 RepID=A0A2H0QX71_9BACT|nr:MAG: endonuclease III [Candidatus Zambryskibacteria bacterium CG10_big_fil_rev_8_21_14_0_10_42_12]